VSVIVPEKHYLYADQMKIKADSSGKILTPNQVPVNVSHTDEFGTHDIYPGGKTYHWLYPLKHGSPYKVTIDFQGCKDKTESSNAVCFMPSSDEFINPGITVSSQDIALPSKPTSDEISGKQNSPPPSPHFR